MSSAYIVMKTYSSPVAIGFSVPHEVYMSKKEAVSRARALNFRAQRCTYDVQKASFVTGPTVTKEAA